MSDKFITLAELPGLKLNGLADDYTKNWFLTHGVLAKSGLAQLGQGNADKPLVYFRTHEVDLDSPKNAGLQSPFQSDIGPLRIRGTMTGTNVDAQVGLCPSPAVFYPLADFKGDLAKESITKEMEDTFFKGKVTLSLPKNKHGFAGGPVANVDWLGLGMKLVDQLMQLFK